MESSRAWMPNYTHFHSPLQEEDNYQDNVLYAGPITRQKFNYATPASRDNNLQIVRTLDPHKNVHQLLSPKPVLRATPILFEAKQVQFTINSISFSVQEAGIFFRCRI